ncbi:uncharacterized protein LOC133178907 [Saccostrea echinata]|uniref:uncharacterized protein LOC133178907 n=1 Tax=Saccostrea echinata TaxID=191078 RepID=UPI002A83DE0F|nr:uncharacterized protein LOC133178907 [Saccostrea echinata]
MSDLQHPVTTTVSTLTPIRGGIVQQSHVAAANTTDVAASTSTAIAVPGGAGTRSTAVAASGGNVAALQTTATLTATGKAVTVGEDPRAKLMFYLSNISSVFVEFYDVCRLILQVESDDDIFPLLDHDAFYKLTTKQSDQMLRLCEVLCPNVFINKCIFQDAAKCGNFQNEFFKLEEVEKSLAIQNEVIIRGEKRHVSKIMYYTPNYLNDNYFEPMKHLDHRLRVLRRGETEVSFAENYKLHLLMSLIFPFWVVIWTALCVYESRPGDQTPASTVP